MHNNEFNDFKTKYQGLSQKICPSQISQDLERKLQRLSLQVHNTLKMESYSRQDFIVDDKENAYCLEANSRAGMTRTSIFPKEAKAIGIEFNDLCEIIIKHGLDRQKAKSMSL
jgi:D-alanine-D-alanine ligase